MPSQAPATTETPLLPGLPSEAILQLATIASRLEAAGCTREAARLRRCQSVGVVRVCRTCNTRYALPWHCNQRICPICARQLAAERSTTLRAMLALIPHPKHVVLTVRNPSAIDPAYLRRTAQALRKLRRKKLPEPWYGGTWSLEVTNESRGWHPHYHLLVSTPWIDPGKLAVTWAKLVGQDDFAIVSVRAVASEDYAQELAKYVAKPDQLATWPQDELAQYVRALKAVRAWGVWGNARQLWPVARHMAQIKSPYIWQCKVCGSTAATYERPIAGVEDRYDPAPYGLAN